MVFRLKHKLGGQAPFFYIYIIKLKVMELLEQIINTIKEFLFGVAARGEKTKTGFHTTCNGCYTNFGDWCKEFRVGMLYDRKAVHI